MGKIFQIFAGECYNDVTAILPDIEMATERYTPETIFVKAPDYVQEGWKFDGSKTGVDRFIRPPAPEGYEYDEETQMLIRVAPMPEVFNPIKENAVLKAKVEALVERNEILEDVLQELILKTVKEDP